MRGKKVSRRIFLMGAGATVAGCATGALGKRGRVRYKSPNEKLNIAGIGVGGKGRVDIQGCSDENIVALCDVDGDRAAESFQMYPEVKRYTDFRVMLEKQKDIDAVTVSTPDHTHCVAAMAAMELDKHVFVQKPLTHSIWEARMLQKTARRYNVATQMGNQGHADEGVRQFCEMIWSGVIGDIREAHLWTDRPLWAQGIPNPLPPAPIPEQLDWDLWLGPAPWRAYSGPFIRDRQLGYAPWGWRGWWDFGTGALGDMACHIMDPCNWALNLVDPVSVETVELTGKNSQTAPLSSVIKYEFPARKHPAPGRPMMPPLTVYWYDGGNMPPRPKGVPEGELLGEAGPDKVREQGRNGSYVVGDKGVITTGTYGGFTRLVPEAISRDYSPPPKTIKRVVENDIYKDWIQACKGGEPACSNFDYAVPLTELVLLGVLAQRADTKLTWDSKRMKVTNVPEATEYVRREYRKGWKV
jgi:predicted dehydrogenase